MRAISFFLWAQEYYNDTASINAFNDLHYSRSLLICYVGCLVSSLLFAVILRPRPHAALFLPGIILLIPVLAVLILRPEEPIVLFPTLGSPWRSLHLSIAALLIAAVLAYLLRKTERTDERSRKL